MTMLRRLLRDTCGAMAIETVIVAPVLAAMSLGTFEVGTLVSRQQELQSAASEAEGIILAVSASEIATPAADIEEVIEDSLNLDPNQVTLQQKFRCNDSTSLADNADACDSTEPIYVYVDLTLTDSYAPVWVNYGIGHGFDYEVTRTVMVQ